MIKMRKVGLALVIFGLSVSLRASAQDTQSAPDQAPPAEGTPQSQPAPPAPAFGQNAPVLDPANPPVSGLDAPNLDLRTASRSFIAPALQVSESVDSNAENDLGPTKGVESVTRVIGALDLQKFWTKDDLFVEYLGGGAFYSDPYDIKQLQAVGVEGVTRWRTGQATLRDAFSYLPDGSFQLGFGGDPGLDLANGSFGTGLQGGGLAGLTNPSATTSSVGNIPHLANLAVLDVVQALNPRSAITVAGGLSNAHFYDPTDSLINSDEVTVEAGYSHLISRRDQLGFVYAFQLFQFPQATGGEVYINVINLRYSHTISGRMSFVAGAGPQFVDLEAGGQRTSVTLSARVQLHYKFSHGSMIASYEKFTSAGSGFFAGANTQAVRLLYTRPLGRTWTMYADAGYDHNSRLQDVSSCQNPLDPNCSSLGASNASSYDDGSAGIVLRKNLGRSYEFFTSYRFAEIAFNTPGNAPVCLSGASTCGRTATRNVGTIGVEWHPRPTRIE